MNKKVFLIILLAGYGLASFGQQVHMIKTFGGARFEMDTLTLTMRQVLEVIYDNQNAYNEFKSAKVKYGISGVLGFGGGLLVCIPLVTAGVGGKPEWTFAAVGGAMILGSIPFTRSFYRHAANALEEYNAKFQTGKLRVKPSFYFTGTGAKIVLRF